MIRHVDDEERKMKQQSEDRINKIAIRRHIQAILAFSTRDHTIRCCSDT